MKKRLIVGLLVMTMFVTLIPTTMLAQEKISVEDTTEGTVEVADAGQNNLADFDLNVYKANLSLKEGNNPINNGVIPYYQCVERQRETSHPSRILLSELNSSEQFLMQLTAWDLLTMDPSKFADDALEEKDNYTGVLLAMLNIATSNDKAVEFASSKWSSNAMTGTSWILEYLQDNYNITMTVNEYKNCKISDIPKNELSTAYQQLMKNKYNVTLATSKIESAVGLLIDGASTGEEVINDMTSWCTMYQMETEIFDVLREMKANTNNTTLQYALDQIIACEDDQVASIATAFKEAYTDEFQMLYRNLVGGMWSGIAKASPAGTLYIAQKTAQGICDLCLSTDEISEQYWKMTALCKVEDALYTSVGTLGKTYAADKTTENAKAYNQAVELYFNIYGESCDYAKEFADIVYKKSLVQAFQEKGKYQEFVDAVTSMKSIGASNYEALKENYIYFLEEDYPEIYKQMKESQGEFTYGGEVSYDKVPVTGITVEKDTLEWGTNDLFLSIPYTISPSNATCTAVTYSSSDENIVRIKKNGDCSVMNPGTAVLTVTTVDGGYQAQVTINAVKDHGKDGFQLTTAETNLDAGTCGENATWKLSNGTLYITGQGKMDDWKCSDNGFEITPWEAKREEIKKIIISDGITNIGESAFCGCSSLRSLQDVSIPSSVTNIGAGAFADCDKLEYVELPEGVKSVENGYTFSYCDNLKKVVIPNSVEQIGRKAFRDCGKLEDVVMPDGIKHIDEKAFSECDALESVTMPNNVKSIGEEAFSYSGLKKIRIPNSVTDMGYSVFRHCTKLEDVKISNRLTIINSGLFENCYSLKNITIPDGVTSIGGEAFFVCEKLESATIPRSVTSIGAGAFRKCDKFKDLYYKGTKAEWDRIDINPNESLWLEKVTVHYMGKDDAVKPIVISQVKNLKVKNIKGKKLKVTWSKNAKATGYQLQYSLKSSFPKNGRTNKWITSNKTTRTTLSKLKKNKKYYVRMRCYVTQNGKKTYSKWTTSGRVTVKK